jgi:hypothetical protein
MDVKVQDKNMLICLIDFRGIIRFDLYQETTSSGDLKIYDMNKKEYSLLFWGER